VNPPEIVLVTSFGQERIPAFFDLVGKLSSSPSRYSLVLLVDCASVAKLKTFWSVVEPAPVVLVPSEIVQRHNNPHGYFLINAIQHGLFLSGSFNDMGHLGKSLGGVVGGRSPKRRARRDRADGGI
jgi:hypothetical protein